MSSRGGGVRGPRRWWASIGVAVLTVAVVSSCSVDIYLGSGRVDADESTAPAPTDGTIRPQRVANNGERLILNEEFAGTDLDAGVWNTCHWWDEGGCTIATNDELEWYLPGQARVADGMLRLTAERRDAIGADGEYFPYVSGMVSTGPPAHQAPAKLAFTYGTVEVAFRAPLGAGLWPAVWMLPASESSKPEIDIFEAVGQRPRTAGMYFHPNPESGTVRSFHHHQLPPGEDLADTHVVRLQWSPERLDFYFDGDKVWEVTGPQVPDEPMYLVINLAVGGEDGGTPDPAVFPATFEIDYARIWSGGAR